MVLSAEFSVGLEQTGLDQMVVVAKVVGFGLRRCPIIWNLYGLKTVGFRVQGLGFRV